MVTAEKTSWHESGDVTHAQDSPPKRAIDWEDPTVEVGNSPPMPGWQLVAACIAWIAGIAFLIAMMISRTGDGGM